MSIQTFRRRRKKYCRTLFWTRRSVHTTPSPSVTDTVVQKRRFQRRRPRTKKSLVTPGSQQASGAARSRNRMTVFRSRRFQLRVHRRYDYRIFSGISRHVPPRAHLYFNSLQNSPLISRNNLFLFLSPFVTREVNLNYCLASHLEYFLSNFSEEERTHRIENLRRR